MSMKPVKCSCGYEIAVEEWNIKGSVLTCWICGKKHLVPRGEMETNEKFKLKKYLIKQKHLAFGDKYFVYDTAGNEVLFVERPLNLWFFVIILLISVGCGAAIVVGVKTDSLLIGLLIFLATCILPLILLASKTQCHIYIYDDNSKRKRLLSIFQRNICEFSSGCYDVVDEEFGRTLGRLQRLHLKSLFFGYWIVRDSAGNKIGKICEDSVVRALIRRFIPLGRLIKTNFNIFLQDKKVASFIRRWTILDRYVLDLTPDVEGILDGRLAVAMGVLLDTAEKQ